MDGRGRLGADEQGWLVSAQHFDGVDDGLWTEGRYQIFWT
jgi:hypothetical protein